MRHTENARTERNSSPREYKEPIASSKVLCDGDRKKFFFDLNENERGIYLRIKEASGMGRNNFIMVPAASLVEFSSALEEMIAAYALHQ